MDATEAAAWVAIAVTLGVAVVGWHRGNRAEQHAAEALDLARSAEARADRLERLAVERRDVTWARHDVRGEAGWVAYTNVGSDTAYDVRLLVDPQGRARREVSADEVAPTERISLQMADFALGARRLMMELIEQNIYTTGSVQCRVRIVWRSASGVEESVEFTEVAV